MNEKYQSEKLKRGGGQFKSIDDVLDARLIIRFRKKDLDNMDSVLKERGITRSDYGRAVLLRGIDRFIEDQFFQKLSQVKFEYRKIGVNINQLAKRINQSVLHGFSQSDIELLNSLDKRINDTLYLLSSFQNSNNKKHDSKNIAFEKSK
jgi:hypothetical protein